MLSLKNGKDITQVWEELAQQGGRIVYLVLDGAGGILHPDTGKTALQAAYTPNLDRLAETSSCGMLELVGPGITPGSGPGHLALFGYEPLRFTPGRGVLSALGIDFDLQEGDIAARVNFATLDADGNISDRRAGRISTEQNKLLCEKIKKSVHLDIDGQYFFETVSEHRAVFIIRSWALGADVSDTDPQITGVTPKTPEAKTPHSGHTAELAQAFVKGANRALADEPAANTVLLRGFAQYSPLRSLKQRFHLNGLCVAQYPMYRGVSRLIGMDLADPVDSVDASFKMLTSQYNDKHDFYFLHVKHTDTFGEDGNFAAKVGELEKVDRLLPQLMELKPDTLIVTADHSTPASMAKHSWHPVPVLLHARDARVDDVSQFDEYSCMRGSLGLRPGIHLMGLALAHAGRLKKFGA